jgi:hypothetical protein
MQIKWLGVVRGTWIIALASTALSMGIVAGFALWREHVLEGRVPIVSPLAAAAAAECVDRACGCPFDRMVGETC